MSKQYGLDTTQLEADRLVKEQEIRDKYAQIEEDKQKAIDATNLANLQKKYQGYTKILEKFSELTKSIGDIAEQEAKADEIRISKKYANQLAEAEGNAELTKQIEAKKQKEIEKEQRKAFKIKKASSIAGAVIDGAKAITSTLAEYPKFDGGIAMWASIATTLVTTGLAIAKIKNTQFEGDGGSGSGTGGATSGGSVAPSFNVVGATSGNQLAQLEQQPIKAYVVSSEVSSAQELDRNRIMNATL
jgi:hypothetical protein